MKRSIFTLCFFATLMVNSQYELKPVEVYTPNIGIMVYMLEDLKARITDQVKELDQSQTDFEFDEKANSIGTLVMHLIATEAYYQIETLEGRQLTAEEQKRFGVGGELNATSKALLKDKPINHYLNLWNEVREKTLKGLKTKDDTWFASMIEDGINYHWVWYHVMEHQANHMGQIALVKNRLPK